MADQQRREPRSYRLNPLERRGVIVGLQPSQLAVLGVAVLAAVAVARVIPTTGGFFLAALTLFVVAAVALWPIRGQPPVDWLPVIVGWGHRRSKGPSLAPAPTIGSPARRSALNPLSGGGRRLILGQGLPTPWSASGVGLNKRHRRRRGDRRASTRQSPLKVPGVAGVQILWSRLSPGGPPMAIVRDRHNGCWSAVIRVRGTSFPLLDRGEKQRRLGAWGSLLASVGRPGTPVHRLQWLEVTLPGRSDEMAYYLGEAACTQDSDALASYADLIDDAGPASVDHDALVVLTIHPRRSLRMRRAVAEQLGREVRILIGQLRTAELQDCEVLGPGELIGCIRRAYDPTDLVCEELFSNRVHDKSVDNKNDHDEHDHHENGSANAGAPGTNDGAFGYAPMSDGDDPGSGGGPRSHSNWRDERADAGNDARPWPLATDEAWSAFRTDGAWHATFWMAEWPRVEVGPDFLSPLLLLGGCRRVALVAGPVDPRRAVREAGSARTADMADAELRRRGGFVPSVRQEREAAGVMQRETELADGHVDYRFSGYVTVTAAAREELGERCAEVEQAAQRAHVELRRLYGRQQEAFAWTLPLGRGLS